MPRWEREPLNVPEMPSLVAVEDTQLCPRFSALVVQAETMEAALVDGKPFDSSAHAHISSTLVRLAARVGLNRVPKNVTPSLHDYLESKVAETEAAHE